MDQVFGDSWLADLAAFRRSPRPFLLSRRITPDSLVLDILQILCTERSEVVKISLLHILQEHVDVLFSDSLSVEHTFASLKDMFEQSEGGGEVNFRAQILTTLTTLAVSFDFLVSQSQLLSGFISSLLASLSKVNAHDQSAVRSCACHCLRELELMYPGLLAVKLGHFFVMANMEQSYIAQDYMALAVTVMEHVLHMVITDPQWHTEQSLNHWITSRSEPLLPYTLPESLPDLDADSKARLSLGSLLPSIVDTKELRRAVSVVMEFTPLMTPGCHLLTIRELMDCVRWTGLAPTTFKNELLSNLATASLPFLHLALLLKMKFPTEFLEPEEEDLLLHRLLIFANHPGVPNDQRLVAFSFLHRYPYVGLGQTVVPTEDCFNSALDAVCRQHIYPTVFDSDALMHIKLDSLSLLHLADCSSHNGGGGGGTGYNADAKSSTASMDDSRGTLLSRPVFGKLDLMVLLECLHKPLQYGVRGSVAVALYHLMFALYKRHGQTSMAEDIYRLLVGTVTRHPCYTAHTIDFLECVRKSHPDSPLPLMMLQALGEQTVSIDTDALVKQLPYHLTLLQQVACEARVDPSSILSYLLRVLHSSSLCQQGQWSIGNKILSICSSALQHHSSSSLYKDVCNLLILLSAQYNDVDIRDRARLFYSLVTSVSSSKLMDLLTQGSDDTSASQRLTRLVEVGLIAPSFPPATPVQTVSECLLKLTRIPQDVITKLPHRDYRAEPMASVNGADVFTWYIQQVQLPSHQMQVTLPCFLHYSESCPYNADFKQIYAICVHLTTQANYAPVEDGLVIYLRRRSATSPVSSPPACSPVSLVLCPLSPVPALFSVRASFSGKGGDTFSTNLADLLISFSDLFLPLDLPPAASSWSDEEKVCARQLLFESLWTGLVNETCGLKHIQTVVCLNNTGQATGKLIREELSHFIILDTAELVLIAIALPPRHTLLLRVSSEQQRSIFSIVTDIWEVLPYIESYLQSLERRSKTSTAA
ncbi:AP-5 complex subunit beta-1-like [Sycon ciliatum]|uniref:AP-5 complex subunit beta-1-like n=1 Tax=Sycon ciliatum TaxID=27933 RepID=UPI0031F6815F